MTVTASTRPILSIAIPCYNEQAGLRSFLEQLQYVAADIERSHGVTVEVVLVDDGSCDGTWDIIRKFTLANGRVLCIKLSRNFGHQAAMWCGLHFAEGDAVVTMDGDGQDPPEFIPTLVSRWQDGAEVVLAVRSRRVGERRMKVWSAKAFYRLLIAMGASRVRADCGDFRLLSQRCVQAILSIREANPFLRGLVGWIGFPTVEVFYDRKPRQSGTAKYTLLKLIALARDGFVSTSSHPLRFAWLAAVVPLFALIGFACAEVLGATPFRDSRSTFLAVVIGAIANLLCLGLVGEYIAIILANVRQRPLYFVEEIVVCEPTCRPDAGKAAPEPT